MGGRAEPATTPSDARFRLSGPFPPDFSPTRFFYKNKMNCSSALVRVTFLCYFDEERVRVGVLDLSCPVGGDPFEPELAALPLHLAGVKHHGLAARHWCAVVDLQLRSEELDRVATDRAGQVK